MLEGKLQAVDAARDLVTNELKGAQTQLADAVGQISRLHAEGESWRRQAEEFQRINTELKVAVKSARTPRKSKE